MGEYMARSTPHGWAFREGNFVYTSKPRYAATHYHPDKVPGWHGSDEGVVDLEVLKRRHAPECQCPVGYFHPDERQCEICELKDKSAITELALFRLDITRYSDLEEFAEILYTVATVRFLDDDLRLVVADVFDEHGLPEGELIRIETETRSLKRRLSLLTSRKREIIEERIPGKIWLPESVPASGIIPMGYNYVVQLPEEYQDVQVGTEIPGLGVITGRQDDDGYTRFRKM